MSRTHWFGCLLSVVLLITTATQAEADDADYIIRVTYGGPLAIREVEVLLYDTDRACDALIEDPEDPPSPDVPWTSLVIVPDADGSIPERALEVPVGVDLQYAVARGEPSDGFGAGVGYFATFGCTDEITGDPTQATVIDIDMHHLWPEVAGTYYINQRMDALDNLPWHVRLSHNSIKEFINDPGLGVLRLLAIAGGGARYWEQRPWSRYFTCEAYDSYREFVYCTQVSPTKTGLRQAGRLSQHMDDNLAEYWAVPDASLRRALRSARDVVLAPVSIGFAGILVITAEADPTGYVGNSNRVVFDSVTWEWRGGERTFDLRNEAFLHGHSIAASVGFHPADPDTYSLAIDPYGLDLSYGELLVWALDGVALPEALSVVSEGGDVIDEPPPISSFEQFFVELVNCETLPRALVDSCWSLRATAVETLSIWSTSPVPEIESWATWGTPLDNPCRISLESDPPKYRVQALGGPSPHERCVWSGELSFVPRPRVVPILAEWWGERL